MFWIVCLLIIGLGFLYLAWLLPIRSPRAVKWLWSKGVALSCEQRWGSSYWCLSTETRTPPESFWENQNPEGGVTYIRLGTANSQQLDLVSFSELLPRLTQPMVLLTTDGDSSVPGDLPAHTVKTILEAPNILRWYTQNWDGTKHPKLRPFPIGLDFHTRRILFLPPGYPHALALGLMARFARPLSRRKKKIFCDVHLTPWKRHKGERGRVKSFLQDYEGASLLPKRVSQLRVWREFASHAFVISTHGNGLDCHRTWEALILGCIVITKRSSLDALYEGLPVVIVEDWDECLVPENLDRWLLEFSPLTQGVQEKLEVEPWLTPVREELSKTLNG